MDYLGAKIRHFYRFGISNLRQNPGGSNNAGVRAHDAVNICPYLYHFRSYGRAHDSRGVIGAAASKSGRRSVPASGYKTRYYGHGIVANRRQEYGADALIG